MILNIDKCLQNCLITNNIKTNTRRLPWSLVGPGYEGLFAQVIFPSARMSLNIKKKTSYDHKVWCHWI